MYRRVGDAEGSLRNHAGFLGVFDREFQVAVVVQSAERTGDVHTLGFLYLEHESSNIGGHGIHTQGVQCAFQHLCLDASFVEGLCPFANRRVRVFAVQQVYLFGSTAVGLYTAEAAHVDDDGSDFL